MGSKGRDSTNVKRVAAQVKTIEFDSEFLPTLDLKSGEDVKRAGQIMNGTKSTNFGASKTRYRMAPLFGVTEGLVKQDLSSAGVLVPKSVAISAMTNSQFKRDACDVCLNNTQCLDTSQVTFIMQQRSAGIIE